MKDDLLEYYDDCPVCRKPKKIADKACSAKCKLLVKESILDKIKIWLKGH